MDHVLADFGLKPGVPRRQVVPPGRIDWMDAIWGCIHWAAFHTTIAGL